MCQIQCSARFSFLCQITHSLTHIMLWEQIDSAPTSSWFRQGSIKKGFSESAAIVRWIEFQTHCKYHSSVYSFVHFQTYSLSACFRVKKVGFPLLFLCLRFIFLIWKLEKQMRKYRQVLQTGKSNVNGGGSWFFTSNFWVDSKTPILFLKTA